MAPSRVCSRLLCPLIGTILAAQTPTVLDIQNPAALQGMRTFSATLSGFAFSDPVSLDAFGKRWQGDFTPRGGEQGFLASVNASVVYQQGRWEYRLWHQQRVLMLGNRDTVEFLRSTKSREDLPAGRTYDLKLSVSGIRRTGATISRSWLLLDTERFSWSVGAGGKGWFADRAQNGSVSGWARATGVKSYDFDLNVDYQYTDNLLYDLPVPASTGVGIGGAVGTVFHARTWLIEAAVDDLGSRTWWKVMPYTSASAKSRRQRFDPGGYMTFDPTIEGVEGEQDWVQKTPAAWMARVALDRYAWRMGLRAERLSNVTFPALEVAFHAEEAGCVGLSYEPRTRSWGLGWAGNHLRIGLISQARSPVRTRSMGFSIGWSSGRPLLR